MSVLLLMIIISLLLSFVFVILFYLNVQNESFYINYELYAIRILMDNKCDKKKLNKINSKNSIK